MRKCQISPTPASGPPSSSTWLDVKHKGFGGSHVRTDLRLNPRYRVCGAGVRRTQGLNNPAHFDKPQELKRIWLVFEDSENTRMQEFVLRWSSDNGNSFREIVRQQWSFSPPDSVREVEDYAVELADVTALELTLVPDKSGGEARASLASFRLA
jgi:hypothetical protein